MNYLGNLENEVDCKKEVKAFNFVGEERNDMKEDLVFRIKNIDKEIADTGRVPRGLMLALAGSTELSIKDISEKLINILETEDVSDLNFGDIDLSNDIKTFEQFKSVLFTDGVVWRSYVDSSEDYDGILFGDGKFFSNFRNYGFQLSGNMNGDVDCGSFYNHTFNSIGGTRISNKAKIELLETYTKSIRAKHITDNGEEIARFIEWFVEKHLSHGRNLIEPVELDFSEVKLLKLTKIGDDLTKLPKEVKWELESVKDNYQRFVAKLAIQVREGQLYINNMKILNKEATDLFLSIGKHKDQLITIISGLVNTKGMSADFK